MNRIFAATAFGLAIAVPATAATVSFTGTYSQDFNGLGTSGAQTVPGSGPHAIEGILGSTGPNVLAFSYGLGTSLTDATIGVGALDFAVPFSGGGELAVDGNDPQFQTAINGIIGGFTWAPGESIVLRWDLADLPGQDNGLAIDDLVIVGVIPAPGAIALLTLAGLGSARRRR